MYSKCLLAKDYDIFPYKNATNKIIQFANKLSKTLRQIQADLDDLKSQYQAAGISLPNQAPEYKSGMHELAVLFEHSKLSDDYSYEAFKSILSVLKTEDFKDCMFWEGLIPVGEEYLFCITIQSQKDSILKSFFDITGPDLKITGLMPIEQRWIYSPKKNSIVYYFALTEVLEIKKGIVGDLKAEKSGYETGRLQEFLKDIGWSVRQLRTPS